MVVYLYQSELVRVKNCLIHPKRIKSAKLKCLEAATKQAKLFSWKIKNVPKPYRDSTTTPWKLFSAVIILNYSCTGKNNSINQPDSLYNTFANNFSSLSKHFDCITYLLLHLQSLFLIKKKSSLHNSSKSELHSLMDNFSIARYDIDPWLIPRYSSFIKFSCCFQSNHTTLDIHEYLYPDGHISGNGLTSSFEKNSIKSSKNYNNSIPSSKIAYNTNPESKISDETSSVTSSNSSSPEENNTHSDSSHDTPLPTDSNNRDYQGIPPPPVFKLRPKE
ncbi:hypothetical protein AYI69_g7696 [Smittium culicis]|uniref:Uncharacterized protein n=1 Tax=Smittium culicis TaxID=133412 RepID=A0A1R1XQ33_9FUNG|nr:hypothetical protein AYI69_g7696 [Smittium culicis]